MINTLILLTIGYFIIGIAWAWWMHTRITNFPRAKWVVFLFNLNMWPECMVIWVWLQVYKFIKWNKMSVTLEQLLSNQRALNKENRGRY